MAKSGLWGQNAPLFAQAIPSNAIQNRVFQLDTVQDQTDWMSCFKRSFCFQQIAIPFVLYIVGPSLLTTRPRQRCENRAHTSQVGLFSSFHDSGFHLSWQPSVVSRCPRQQKEKVEKMTACSPWFLNKINHMDKNLPSKIFEHCSVFLNQGYRERERRSETHPSPLSFCVPTKMAWKNCKQIPNKQSRCQPIPIWKKWRRRGGILKGTSEFHDQRISRQETPNNVGR